MRLLVRLALIGCAFILFLIFIAYNKSSNLESIEEQKEAGTLKRIVCCPHTWEGGPNSGLLRYLKARPPPPAIFGDFSEIFGQK